MRIVLFGQKWLAAKLLKRLVALPNVTVLAVCPDTEPDRLADAARKEGVPVVGMASVPSCDMAVAAYCQKYIPSDVRARCGLGILAYHPSLLPRHRGRDAVRWTIAMHEPVAGGTAYWMDDGADTGPIEAQDWCHVLPGETAAELWRRELAPMGVRLLTACVARLARGERPHARPQDERVATFEPAVGKNKLGQ
ncbi:formyltransferase family protein [uncultured Desulfovibrio sp.]|uniref:formyltransferase family protein n=1 Tax=uncultured Desulfovibrio sp. TaxID=167968 RepID=UPI00260470AF|nr:formyltransferase family protein [uncultured Desulfovibrio sp.]